MWHILKSLELDRIQLLTVCLDLQWSRISNHSNFSVETFYRKRRSRFWLILNSASCYRIVSSKLSESLEIRHCASQEAVAEHVWMRGGDPSGPCPPSFTPTARLNLPLCCEITNRAPIVAAPRGPCSGCTARCRSCCLLQRWTPPRP